MAGQEVSKDRKKSIGQKLTSESRHEMMVVGSEAVDMLGVCNWSFVYPVNIQRHCAMCQEAVVASLVTVSPLFQ